MIANAAAALAERWGRDPQASWKREPDADSR
jgi:hypothetical protein